MFGSEVDDDGTGFAEEGLLRSQMIRHPWRGPWVAP